MFAVDINQIPLDIGRTSDWLFSEIINDIAEQGFSIKPNALPQPLAETILDDLLTLRASSFAPAGIGRADHKHNNRQIRSDFIHWLGDQPNDHPWLTWADELRTAMNRELFLGLNRFECHYSHYEAGSFYKKHLDAFRGGNNRRITLITYLNHHWGLEEGGELVIYKPDGSTIKVTPSFGTVVCFLSEEFPHEVLAAKRDRYSVTGWFG